MIDTDKDRDSDFVAFNLNRYVRVKLNKTGHTIYFNYRSKLANELAEQGLHDLANCVSLSLEKDGDYAIFQMHQLFTIFGGGKFRNGGKSPFEKMEILFEPGDLIEVEND